MRNIKPNKEKNIDSLDKLDCCKLLVCIFGFDMPSILRRDDFEQEFVKNQKYYLPGKNPEQNCRVCCLYRKKFEIILS